MKGKHEEVEVEPDSKSSPTKISAQTPLDPLQQIPLQPHYSPH